jgi:hypothetical protein
MGFLKYIKSIWSSKSQQKDQHVPDQLGNRNEGNISEDLKTQFKIAEKELMARFKIEFDEGLLQYKAESAELQKKYQAVDKSTDKNYIAADKMLDEKCMRWSTALGEKYAKMKEKLYIDTFNTYQGIHYRHRDIETTKEGIASDAWTNKLPEEAKSQIEKLEIENNNEFISTEEVERIMEEIKSCKDPRQEIELRLQLNKLITDARIKLENTINSLPK